MLLTILFVSVVIILLIPSEESKDVNNRLNPFSEEYNPLQWEYDYFREHGKLPAK